jgi:hypothetical protein
MLKVIVGKAGSGKTQEVAQMAVNKLYTSESVLVLIAECTKLEMTRRVCRIAPLTTDAALSIIEIDSIGGMCKHIVDTEQEVVLIDAHSLITPGVEKFLSVINRCAVVAKKKVWITMQANANAEGFSNEKPIIIYDWEEMGYGEI